MTSFVSRSTPFSHRDTAVVCVSVCVCVCVGGWVCTRAHTHILYTHTHTHMLYTQTHTHTHTSMTLSWGTAADLFLLKTLPEEGAGAVSSCALVLRQPLLPQPERERGWGKREGGGESCCSEFVRAGAQGVGFCRG